MAVQLAVSSLCKERLTSLKQVTTLCKKQELLYKPLFGTDLKCLRVPLFSFSHGTSQKSKHPSLLSFNMQLIPRGSDLKTLCLSLFLFFRFSFSLFLYLSTSTFYSYVQHSAAVAVQGQSRSFSVIGALLRNAHSRLRRGRCLERIAGSSLATSRLVLQKRINHQKRILIDTLALSTRVRPSIENVSSGVT